MIKTYVYLLLCAVCLSFACQSKTSQAQEALIKPATTTTSATSATTSSTVKDGSTFTVIYPNTILATGNGQQVIKVLAKSGYKVNKDFPARIKVNSTPNITFEAEQITGVLASKTELSYTLKFKAKPGQHTVSATADFSICDDASCQLYPNEKLSWTVQVQ